MEYIRDVASVSLIFVRNNTFYILNQIKFDFKFTFHQSGGNLNLSHDSILQDPLRTEGFRYYPENSGGTSLFSSSWPVLMYFLPKSPWVFENLWLFGSLP